MLGKGQKSQCTNEGDRFLGWKRNRQTRTRDDAKDKHNREGDEILVFTQEFQNLKVIVLANLCWGWMAQWYTTRAVFPSKFSVTRTLSHLQRGNSAQDPLGPSHHMVRWVCGLLCYLAQRLSVLWALL